MAENEDSDMKRYADMMARKYPKQNAYAVRSVLNTMAIQSRKDAQGKGTEDFTKRSAYINRTIRYKGTSSLNVDSMETMFGQLSQAFGKPAGQLAIQQTGGILKPDSGKRLKKGTLGSRTGKTYKRPVAKRFNKSRFLSPKKFFKGSPHKPHTRRGQAIGLIDWARRNKFPGLVVLSSPQKNKFGAFKIGGPGKRGGKARFNMAFNLEKKEQRIEAVNWLEKSYKDSVKKRDKTYAKEMFKQIERLKKETRL